MNKLFGLVLCCVTVAACDDDEGTPPPPPDAPVAQPDAAPGAPDAAPGAPDAAPGMPDAAPTADAPPSMASAPVINGISWTTPAGCTTGVSSVYTITIDVTDADTPAGSLSYSGSLLGCSGTVDTNPDTVTCPNFAPYGGTITVSDPEGNSDSLSITINPCMNGSAP